VLLRRITCSSWCHNPKNHEDSGQLLHRYSAILVSCVYRLYIFRASVSEPLSSDLNVNFVCLSVGLSVMDRQLTVNHFRLLFCVFCIMR